MNDSVGSRLEALCRRAGVSFRGADDLAGRTPGHCQAIVRGTIRRVEAPTLVAYARALGSTVGYLVAGEGEPPTDEALAAAVASARARHEAEKAGPAVDRSPEFVQADADGAS